MKKENEIRVLMVEPHEHPKEFLLENTLQVMQEAVGGLIDIVDIDDDGTCLLLNDEGKLIGLEGNRRIGDDVIVGNFYVCGSNEDGELASLTEAEMEKYIARVRKRYPTADCQMFCCMEDTGTEVIGFFLKDNSMDCFQHSDFLGELKPEFTPAWVPDALEEMGCSPGHLQDMGMRMDF